MTATIFADKEALLAAGLARLIEDFSEIDLVLWREAPLRWNDDWFCRIRFESRIAATQPAIYEIVDNNGVDIARSLFGAEGRAKHLSSHAVIGILARVSAAAQTADNVLKAALPELLDSFEIVLRAERYLGNGRSYKRTDKILAFDRAGAPRILTADAFQKQSRKSAKGAAAAEQDVAQSNRRDGFSMARIVAIQQNGSTANLGSAADRADRIATRIMNDESVRATIASHLSLPLARAHRTKLIQRWMVARDPHGDMLRSAVSKEDPRQSGFHIVDAASREEALLRAAFAIENLQAVALSAMNGSGDRSGSTVGIDLKTIPLVVGLLDSCGQSG